MSKTCSKCLITKSLDCFGKHARQKDGLNTECKLCNKTRANLYAKANRALINAKSLSWQKTNRKKATIKANAWAAKNREKSNAQKKAYMDRNPGLKKAKRAKRRSAELQRIPIWADLKSIRDFYSKCPKGYEVDHIVPLRGDTVSGLHVLENLQYLSITDNRKKGNKYE